MTPSRPTDNSTPKRTKATVHDVAKRAGVSIATVSRALNTPDAVRPELREEVLKAAKALGYTTNSVGKALRRRRSQVIGTLLPRLADPLFSLVASGVQDALVEHDYVGFLEISGFDNRNLYTHAHKLIQKGAEGLIVFGRIDDDDLLDLVTKQNIPTLTVYSYLAASEIPMIGIDNYAATRQLTELLLDLGHTRIAMISGPLAGNDRQQSRTQAFQDCLHERGLEPLIEHVDVEHERANGAAALQRLISRRSDLTALLCNRDVIAFSAIAECRRMGLSVPDDLSLTGFDDVEYASLLDPPLTSLSVPAIEMGRHAATTIIRHLESGDAMHSACYDTEVILRRSTARPRPARRG
ncbi:LacI family DNA-binding transcriptional regulator [Acuticoccus sp. M5D2P5]|uniref:LacI family DNA-binding transcriptional regulator n=1 Tax=Acuticoccus kalidii TaxID=2910977 RepID=UPI001F1B808A|nr:LacI family DNA-binding transcriptional regulator [Acuticoccus kalidii]